MPPKRFIRGKKNAIIVPNPETSDIESSPSVSDECSSVDLYSDSTQCDSDSDKSTATQNKGESEIETKEATKFREAQWETNQEFIPDIDTEFKGTPNPSYLSYSSRHELSVSYFNHLMKESMFKLLADSSNT